MSDVGYKMAPVYYGRDQKGGELKMINLNNIFNDKLYHIVVFVKWEMGRNIKLLYS